MIEREALLNNPVVSTLLLDTELNILSSNAPSRASLGYSDEEMVSFSLCDLAWDNEAENSLKKSFDELRSTPISVASALHLRTKTGWKLQANLAFEWVREEQQDKRLVVATIAVGSFAVDTVDAALHASRLATLGEMATGVAHELNQPLNVIRMAASNVLRRMDSGEVDTEYLRGKLDRILDQADRAARITSQMRDYGRKTHSAEESFSVSEALVASCSMFAEEFRLAGIKLNVSSFEISPDTVSGNRVSLEQILINLLTNARDALLAGEIVEKSVTVNAEHKGGVIRISVSDSGGGPPEALRQRVFEPFYTTKEPGKGTGLGLYICHGLVTGLGGKLELEVSEQGAAFVINLPLQSDVT